MDNEVKHCGIKFYNEMGEEVNPDIYKKQMYVYNKAGTALRPICGAHTKQSNIGICTKGAGTRTNHLKTGKCYLHGGCSTGAPKGNKNAVKHGLYETLIKDTLVDNEKDYYENTEIDKLAMVDEQIKLLNIRLARAMERYSLFIREQMVLVLKANLTKMESFRLEQLESLISEMDEQTTKIQLSVAKLIETKHKLELDIGSIDEQTEENKKSFANAIATGNTDLYDDIDEGEDDEGDIDG